MNLSLPIATLALVIASGFAPHKPAASAPPAAPVAAAAAPRAAGETAARNAVVSRAMSMMGIAEKTGHNDGPEVEAVLASVGLAKGAPYCAAFVYYVGLHSLGSANPFPRSGWSPDMVASPTWKGGNGIAPRPGDTFGIWIGSKGRVGHTGFIVGTSTTTGALRAPPGFFRTAEGNTARDAASGSANDAEGEGFHSKLRSEKTVYSVRAWLP